MRLVPVSQKDLVKRLRLLGWQGPEYRSDHPFLLKEDSPPLKIPNPHSRDISVDLLKKVLKQANISRSEWLRSVVRRMQVEAFERPSIVAAAGLVPVEVRSNP